MNYTHQGKHEKFPSGTADGRPLDGRDILERLNWAADNPEAAQATLDAAKQARELEIRAMMDHIQHLVDQGDVDYTTAEQIYDRLGL